MHKISPQGSNDDLKFKSIEFTMSIRIRMITCALRHLWFKCHIPRCAFITWPVCRGRLATRYKMKTWGIVECDNCGLRGTKNETIEHLFFSCPISYEVWGSIMAMCNMHRGSYLWSVELN